MKKSFNVEEATEIELKFNNGESLNLAFNVRALSFVNDKCIGGLKKFFNMKSTAEYGAKILYVTAKAGNNEITLEKARELTVTIKPTIISEIINEFNSACLDSGSEDTQKKMVSELVKEIMLENQEN